MPKSLKVKIFVADRIVYQGKARTVALRFFDGNLEVMCHGKEYYASFDRGTITASYGDDIIQYDLNLGFVSSTGDELTVLSAKAKKITPQSSKVSVGQDQQNSAASLKKKTKYAHSFPTDA
jgi:F0F1-type ATP synthase epsilon subunit